MTCPLKEILKSLLNLQKKVINFDKHASGPYGDDIPDFYYDKKSILPYFFNNGLLERYSLLTKKSYPTNNIKFNEKYLEKNFK